MGLDLFTEVAPNVLAKTLDACAARNKSIANNIANVETPGYKRSYVSFEDQLAQVMANDDPNNVRKGVKELTPLRRTDVYSPSRSDGNNVNIDAEISDLAKNQLKYRAAQTLYQARSSIIRSAITEGKR